MTRSVRVLQNTVNAGQTRFTGTVSELSPTAEAHVLAIYQNQLWLSAILGSGENATTVWVPLGRAGMVKTHVQSIPIFTWNVPNVFGSTNVTVQAFDVDGYVYSPSIQVEEDFITVTHTVATAGRLVVISTDNLFSGAPDTGIRYEFVTSFAALPATGTDEVIYVARDTGVAYYYDTNAYHAFGTTVEIVNNLTTNDAGKALSAAQGFALKGLVDSLALAKLDAADVVDGLTYTDATQALSANQGRVLKGLIDTINGVLQSDDGTLNELQEIVNYIKLNRAELDALNIASIAGLQAALDAKLNANDASVTNAREWTATTVDQAEAEAGTATTRRAWTAQRVFQAIAAWWATSAFKTKLDGIEAGAQVNVATDLSLGTRTTTTLPVLSSTGADVTLPAATTSLAGLMSSADKTSLDNLASGVSAGTLLNKYSLLLGTSTGAVNLATSQVWKITDPGSTRTISITNPPASTRSMSVVLQVIGNRATNWPAGVQWADGLAPVLAANWTMIILTYIDGVVYGSVGPSA